MILGGTGAIGRATALRLRGRGWTVVVTGRDGRRLTPALRRAGVAFAQGDRRDPAHLDAVLGDGADLVLDCVCFTAADAAALLPYLDDVGSTVMISSKAVYVDADGNHANTPTPPRFPGPVAETQPTLAPAPPGLDFDSAEGYGPNKVAAERVLLESGRPVTVVRPSKVHGAGAVRPREWVFVRRALLGRRTLVLRWQGAGGDHPSAAANVAALVELAAERPGARTLNCADPDAPSGLEIARTIGGLLGHAWDEVLVDDAPDPVGAHPWDVRPPVTLDLSAARALGWQPVGTYAETVGETVRWLVGAAAGGEEAALLPPPDDPFFASYLDLAAEDAFLARRRPG